MGLGGTKTIGLCLTKSPSMSMDKLQVVASLEAGVAVLEEPGPSGNRDPLIQPGGGELREDPALPIGGADGEGSNVLKISSSFPGTLKPNEGNFPNQK